MGQQFFVCHREENLFQSPPLLTQWLFVLFTNGKRQHAVSHKPTQLVLFLKPIRFLMACTAAATFFWHFSIRQNGRFVVMSFECFEILFDIELDLGYGYAILLLFFILALYLYYEYCCTFCDLQRMLLFSPIFVLCFWCGTIVVIDFAGMGGVYKPGDSLYRSF